MEFIFVTAKGTWSMIDFGLSNEYLTGYSARLDGRPFDNNETDDWKMGWLNANQALKLK